MSSSDLPKRSEEEGKGALSTVELVDFLTRQINAQTTDYDVWLANMKEIRARLMRVADLTWEMYDAVTLAHDHFEYIRPMGGHEATFAAGWPAHENSTGPLKQLAKRLYLLLPPRGRD